MSQQDISLGKGKNLTNVDLNRFKGGVKREQLQTEQEKSIFDALDVDKDGVIDEKEMAQLKEQLLAAAGKKDGANLSNGEAKDLLKELGLKEIKKEDLFKFIQDISQNSENIKSCATDEAGNIIIEYNDGTKETIKEDKTRILENTDDAGRTTSTTLNSGGETVRTVIAEANGKDSTTTDYQLNAENQPVKDDKGDLVPAKTVTVSDEGQVTTETEFKDGVPQQQTITKEGSTTVINYDESGQPKEAVETQGEYTVKNFTYVDGQPREMSRVENKGLDTEKTTTYTYNEDGSVVEQISENGGAKKTARLVKDGKVVAEEITDGDKKITRQVNEDGTSVENIVEGENIVQNQLNAEGNRTAQIKVVDGKEYAIAYDGEGNTEGVVVQNGESPAAIAKRFGVPLDKLFEANKDLVKGKGNGRYFQVGAEIKIPREIDADETCLQGRKSSAEAVAEYQRDEQIREQRRQFEQQLKEQVGLINTKGAGQNVVGHYKNGQKATFKKIGNATHGRTICQDKNGKIYVVAHDGVILNDTWVQVSAHRQTVAIGNQRYAVVEDRNDGHGRKIVVDAGGNSHVLSGGKSQTDLSDRVILRNDYVDASDAYDATGGNKTLTSNGVKYVRDRNGKVWYVDSNTGKFLVKGQYSQFVNQEADAISDKIYDAAHGLGTDEDKLMEGVSEIYSPEILDRVNSSLAAKDDDYQGDSHTMPLEALILDEETHGNSRKYFRTLINNGVMSTQQVGNTVARELQHEIEGGIGYTSTASVNEVMNLIPQGDREARLATERAVGELRPDLRANEGSLTRAYLQDDGWNAQEVDQFDSNWVKNGSYQEARVIYKTDINGNIVLDGSGNPIVERIDQGDQEHRNAVIGRLCFEYDSEEALHKGLAACNDDPNSADYKEFTRRAIQANADREYPAQFTDQEAVQQYLAGRSNDGGEVDVEQLSACNTLLFKTTKPPRVQAEEALYKAKNGDMSDVFTSMEPEVYSQMAEIMANGDIPGCKNVQQAYNKAMSSANPHDKPSIKANAILSGQVSFTQQEITDFCVELMHEIDNNRGLGGSTGVSASHTNDAERQTEQLKAILQNHPEIIADVKAKVEQGEFIQTTTYTQGGGPGIPPTTTSINRDNKADYLNIINNTQCIVNDEIFLDEKGNRITDPNAIAELKKANNEALARMREYVAQLEREFRMGVDEEGWLDDAANSVVRYSGLGTDRDDVVNRYREAKRMLQQLEAAASGRLRDASGNVISAQQLAQSIVDKSGDLEQVNVDYKSSVGMAKMGIVLAPVIAVTTIATAGSGAAGWVAVGVGAGATFVTEGALYGSNLLTSETGNTAENRAAVTSQVLQDTALAATGMKVGQWAENFAVNGVRAVSQAERMTFAPQTWRIVSKVPEGKMKDFMGAVSRASARLEQASADLGANVISKQANLLRKAVPGISEANLNRAAVILARGEAAGLEITSDTVQTLGQMYLIDGEFSEEGFIEGMIMSVAGNSIGHMTSLKGELGEAGRPRAHVDGDAPRSRVGGEGGAGAVTTPRTPVLDGIIGDGNKASGIPVGAAKAESLRGEINQLVSGADVSGSDLADAYTKLNKIQNRDVRRELQGRISSAVDGLSDTQRAAFQAQRALHLKADVNNIIANKSVLEDADVRVINDYIKNENDVEALLQLQQDLQAKRLTSRGTTANFNKLDTAITKKMSQLDAANVKVVDGGDDAVVEGNGHKVDGGDDAVVEGDGHKVDGGDDAVVEGNGHKVDGGDDAVVEGNGHKVDGGDDAVVEGDGHKVDGGDDAVVEGNGHKVDGGDDAVVEGDGHRVDGGDDAVVEGDGHKVDGGDDAVVEGNGHKVDGGDDAVVEGNGHRVDGGDDAVVEGNGHKVDGGGQAPRDVKVSENADFILLEVNGKKVSISKEDSEWIYKPDGSWGERKVSISSDLLTRKYNHPELLDAFAEAYNGNPVSGKVIDNLVEIDEMLDLIDDTQMKQMIIDEVVNSAKSGFIISDDIRFLVHAQSAFEGHSAIMFSPSDYSGLSANARFNKYLRGQGSDVEQIQHGQKGRRIPDKRGLQTDTLLENRMYGIRQYMKQHPNTDISNYMYSKYLDELTTIGVDKALVDKLKQMDADYGCKIMVSANLRNSEAVMNLLDTEFKEWKTASGGQAKFPPVIDFSTAKADWYDTTSAYGQSASGAYSEGMFSGALAFPGMTESDVAWALRHEMTHSNDLTNSGHSIPATYDLNKIMPKKTKKINGVDTQVPDFEHCMYVDEFRKAGIKESHIEYAYNNPAEFIAVASEGDLSKCSAEFRQLLVDFGMPEWQLNMKPKAEVRTSAKAITERQQYADLEDYVQFVRPEQRGVQGFFNRLFGNDIREQGSFSYKPVKLQEMNPKDFDLSGIYIGNRIDVMGDVSTGKLPKGKAVIVPADAKIRLGDSWTLDLGDPQIKNILDNLEEGKILTVGKQGDINPRNGTFGVADNHLQITKVNGEIVIKDVSKAGSEILGNTGLSRGVQLAKRMGNYVSSIADADIPAAMKNTWAKCKSEINELANSLSLPDINIDTAKFKAKYHLIMNDLSAIAAKASASAKVQIKKLMQKLKEMFDSFGVSSRVTPGINKNITGRPDLDKYITPQTPKMKISKESMELSEITGADASHIQFVKDHPELFKDNHSFGIWQGNSPADQHHGAWKMHMFSVDEADWQRMSQTIIPYLNEHGIEWKTLDGFHDANYLNGDIQQGKAFTIYPRDNAHMEQVARDLDYIIKRNNLNIDASDIVGDRQMGNSGRLFYRYEFNTKQAQDEILDLSNRADCARYEALYDSNSGRVSRHGKGSYLADDMTSADDPWLNFDPADVNSKPNFDPSQRGNVGQVADGDVMVYAYRDFSSEAVGTRLPKNQGVGLNQDAVLELPDGIQIDLSSPEIQNKLKELGEGRYLTIGRNSDNDIVINNKYVSGHHLAIEKVGDQLLVTDMSTNGTKIGQRVVNGGINSDNRVSQNPIDQSNRFAQTSRVGVGEVIADGYRDGGRRRTFDADGHISSAGREVVVVDRTKDTKLQNIITDVKRRTANMSDKQKAAFLQKYINNMIGDGSVAARNCDSWERPLKGQDVLLGDIVTHKPPVAVCRHRSLLYKVLGDELGLKVELQRGNFYSNGSGGGHAWNTVRFDDGTSAIFDAMHNKTSSTTPGKVDPYAMNYYTVDNQDLYSGGLSPMHNSAPHPTSPRPTPTAPNSAPAQSGRISVLNNLENKYIPKYTKNPEQVTELLDTIATRIKNGEIPSQEMLDEILEDISQNSGVSVRDLKRDFDKCMSNILYSDWQNMEKVFNQSAEYNAEALEVGGNSTARYINNFKEKRGLLSDSEIKVKQEAQLKAQKEAELKAQQEAQLQAQKEAELQARREAELQARREAERLKQEKLEQFADKYPEVTADGVFRDSDSAVKLIDLMESYDLQMNYGDFNSQYVYQRISEAGIKNDADMDTAFDMIKKRFHADVIAEDVRVKNLKQQYHFSEYETVVHSDNVIAEIQTRISNGERLSMDDIENMIQDGIPDVREFNNIKQRVLEAPELQKGLNDNLHLDVYSNSKYSEFKYGIPNAMTVLDNILEDVKNGATPSLDLVQKHIDNVDTQLRNNGKFLSTDSYWILQDVLRHHDVLGPQCKDFVEDIIQGGF